MLHGELNPIKTSKARELKKCPFWGESGMGQESFQKFRNQNPNLLLYIYIEYHTNQNLTQHGPKMFGLGKLANWLF